MSPTTSFARSVFCAGRGKIAHVLVRISFGDSRTVCVRLYGRVVLNVTVSSVRRKSSLPSIERLTSAIKIGVRAIGGTCRILGQRKCVDLSGHENTIVTISMSGLRRLRIVGRRLEVMLTQKHYGGVSQRRIRRLMSRVFSRCRLRRGQ